MADPLARLEWMGKQVVCYLQPGCEVADKAALVSDVRATCTECGTEAELDAAMEAVASRHHLRVARRDPSVSSDPVERLLAYGFLPPIR